MEKDIVIKFSPRQKLPPGYQVIWSHLMENYYAQEINGDWDSNAYCCRFMARRAAYDHYNHQQSKQKEPVTDE